ncbi:hypothetical protein WJX72_009369 [[Myrmecia] bisecta]|uniref:USP domain-containing protein n=1 Tax=[Myrmecia] bisecta TaxID=41462 RepID=A0AAW1PKP2_9CHLO
MESEFGVDSAFEKINPLVFPRGASSLKDRPHLDAAVVACQQGALQHRSLACAVFYAKLARGHEGQLAAPLLSKALLQKAIQKFNNAPKQLKVLTGEEIEAELQEQARMREGERHRGPRSQSDKSRQDQQERNEAARLQVVVKKAEQKLKEHAKTWAELGTKVSAFLPAKLAEAGPEGSPAQMEALLALCPVSKEELLNAMRSHLALQAAKMRGTPDEGVYACLEKRLLPIILQTKGWESWVYTDASGCAQYFSSGDALLKHWAAVVDWGSDDFGVTSTELWQAYFDGIGVWHHPLPPALPSTTSGAPSAVLTAEESRAAGETLLLEPFLTGLEARALLLQARKHEGPTKYMPLGVPPGVRSHAADILTRWLGPLQHNSEREEMQLGDPFLQHWRQLDRARRQIMTQLARRLEEQAGRTVPEVMTVHFDNEEKSAALASHDASHGELILWLARELAAGNALIVNQLLIAIENATQLRQPDLMFADALESVDDVAAADAIDTPPVDSVTVVDLLRRQRFASCEAGTQVILKWHGGPDPTTEEMTLLQEQASQLSAMRSSGESSVAKAAEQDLDTFADCEDHLPADADAPRTPDRKTTPRTALSTPGEALSRASSSGDHPGEVHGSSSVLGLPMQSVSKPGISPCTDSSPLLKEVLLGDIQLALRFLQDSRMLTECFMRSVGLFMRQHLPAADSADVHLGSLWKLPTERLHEVHQAVAAELAIHGQQLKVVQDAFTFIAGKMKLFEQPGTIRIHEDESLRLLVCAGPYKPPSRFPPFPRDLPESALTAARLQHLLKHMLSLEEAVVPPEGEPPAEAAARQQLHKAGELLRQVVHCRPQAKQFQGAVQEACELFSALLSEEEVLRGEAGGGQALRDWVSLAKRAWEVRTGVYKVYHTAVKQEAERGIQRAEHEGQQESRELVRKLKELEQQLKHLQRIGKGSSDEARHIFVQSQQVKMGIVHLTSMLERETDSQQRKVQAVRDIEADEFILTEDEKKARDTISEAYMWLFSGMEDRQAMEDMGLVSSVRRALHLVLGTTNRMLQKVWGLHVDLTRQMGIYYTLATEIMRMAVNASAVNALDEFLPYYNYALVEKLAKMADVYLEKRQAALADAFLEEVSTSEAASKTGAKGANAAQKKAGKSKAKKKGRAPQVQDKWRDDDEDAVEGQAASESGEPTASEAAASAGANGHAEPHEGGSTSAQPLTDEQLRAKLMNGSLSHLDFQPDFSDLALGEHADLDAYLASLTPNQLKKWKKKKSQRQQELLLEFKQAHAHLVPPASLPDQEGNQEGDQASGDAFVASASTPQPDVSADDGSDWQSVQKLRTRGGSRAARPEAAMQDEDKEGGWEQPRSGRAAKGPSAGPRPDAGLSYREQIGPIFQGQCSYCSQFGHRERSCAKRRTDRDAGKPEAFAVPHHDGECNYCKKWGHTERYCPSHPDVLPCRYCQAAEPDRANGERPFSATLPHDKAQAQARPATDDASPWQTVNQPAQPAADHAQSQANGVPGSAAASRPRPSQRPSPAGVAVQHEAGSAEAGSGPDDAQSAEQRLMQQQQQQLEYYAQQRLKAQQAQQAGWQTPGETRAHSTAAAQDSWAGSGPGTPTSYATGYPASQAPPHIPQSPQRYAPQSYHPSPPAPPPVWGAPSTNGPNPPAYGQASPSRESAARQYASPYSPQPLQPAAAGEAATDFDDLLGNLLGGPQAATPALHPPAQPEGWEDHDYPALGAPPAASWASRVVTKEAADGDQEALMEDDEALQQAIQASLAESSRTRPVPVDSPTAPQPQSQALVPGVATPGLQNATGEYNCFLNVIIQCLWHCSDFRDRLMQWDPQLAQGNDVVAALVDLFHAFAEEAAERREPANLKEHQVVAPTALREALSALPSQNFRMGEMNDASEVLLALYGSLELVKDAAGRALGLDLVNRSFGLEVSESVHCPDCSLETHKTSYTQYFYNVSATALRLVKTFSVDETFGMILRQIEGNHQKTCDTDRGGCGNKLSVRHFLNSVPLIFTLQLAWESQQEEGQDILDTLNGVEEEVDISAVYLGLTEPHIFKLRSMVCYYGAHYHAFVFSAEAGKWLMFDDATINAVGSWRDVVSKCFAGRIQPSVLFYTSSSQETK